MTIANAPGAWGNQNPDSMFGVYLYCFNGEPVTLTITNLPPGTYHVLAYGHGGPPDVQNTRFELLTAGISQGSKRTTTRPGWNTTNWVEGLQYVRFDDVPVYQDHPLVLVSYPDAIPVALLNGVQLVQVNDTPVGTPPTNTPPPPPPPPGPTNNVPSPNGQSAGLLNVNFGTDGTPVRHGPAAIGQDSSDYWNLYSRDDGHGGYRSVANLAPLYWANGTSSGAGLTIENAPGAWGNEVNDPMFGVYLYPLGGGPDIRVTVTNLPAGNYSVLAYGHGGPPDEQNTAFEVISDGLSLGTKLTATNGWKNTNWTDGVQFVTYTNVLVEPDQPLIILAKPAGIPIGMINGLQLRLDAPLGLSSLPAGGLFTNELSVRLLGGFGIREIHYTLDQTDPTTNSPLYRLPIKLQAAATIRAQLFENGVPLGDVISASFQRVYALDDGITADWRRQHFGDGYLTDPRSAADADPDNDGANNLQEFATGSDPLDPLSGFLVRTRLVPSITWKSEPGTKYRVLRKDTISDPQWQLVTEVTATDPLSRFTDADVANINSFYIVEPVR